MENNPRVIKAPDSLFTIKNAQKYDKTEKNKNSLETAQKKKESLENDIKLLNNQLSNKNNELNDLKTKADNIIHEAKQKKSSLLKDAEITAAGLIEDAKKNVEEITAKAREDGNKQGHDEGYTAGLEECKKEHAAIIKTANEKAEQTLLTAQKQVKSYFESVENEIVNLVIEVSKKIIPQQFADNPQLILPVVQTALKKVKNQTDIEVRTSNNTYELVLAAKTELQSMLSGNVRLNIKADDSLSDGDCWIETPEGSIDARLSSQLNEMKKSLKEVVGKYEPDA